MSVSTGTPPRSWPRSRPRSHDGMDVINLSIGEPEVEPSRDLVARALDARRRRRRDPRRRGRERLRRLRPRLALLAGDVRGAITVAAVTTPDAAAARRLAEFSSSGPTPLSLRLKPDVSAPGVSILSSVPGGWEAMSGTSMATPQIAGAAALLRERHPDWPVATIKAALIETGTPSTSAASRRLRREAAVVSPTRSKADVPARPRIARVGLVRARPRRLTATARVTLADAGGGAGVWDVAVEHRRDPRREPRGADACRHPGSARPHRDATAAAADGDLSGFVRLTRGADVRRIPFWLHVSRPALGGEPRPDGHARPAHRQHEREAVARLPLPLPGGARRRRRLRHAAGPGAGVPRDADEARDELRRRHHAPRRAASRSSRASSSRETRTGSPATPRSRSTSIRTSSNSAIPCSRRVPCACSRARTTSSSTAPRRRGRELRLPLLARRHDAADAEAPASRGSDAAPRSSCGSRTRAPGSTRRR